MKLDYFMTFDPRCGPFSDVTFHYFYNFDPFYGPFLNVTAH
jgi:hypothetical protein